MNNRIIANELVKIAKDIVALDYNNPSDRYKDLGWVPLNLRKIIMGLTEVSPYVFLVPTVETGKSQRDAKIISDWAKKNGSPASKVFMKGLSNAPYVKITDPLCRQLEILGLLEKKF